ncbi:MAG: homocysteine S-methyltransferase family protein [Lentisphaerae bacterium]|nr:homocysteine S-methyltransferase family protein [Lentisphaerota bacterium]
MARITEQLKQGRKLASDGAWGTFLQRQGLKPGECPELWCATRREAVLEIARSYVAAGADLIKTNSFGGSRLKLAAYGLDKRVSELNRSAAAISREAAGREHAVIASMGPTGKLLLMGDVTKDELYAAFKEQAQALAGGGADAALIETMSAIDEAALAIKAARENTRLEIICTFTFERTAKGEFRTMMGVTPAQMAEACLAAGADIIGANCGHGIQPMIEVVKEIRAAAPAAPIIVHPNAGLPVNRNGVDVFPDTPAMMAEKVPELLAAGADIVGGCCGAGPEHIAAIAQALRSAAR